MKLNNTTEDYAAGLAHFQAVHYNQPMSKRISRKGFLKLGALALSTLAANPFPLSPDEHYYPSGTFGRITKDTVSVFMETTCPNGVTVVYLRGD